MAAVAVVFYHTILAMGEQPAAVLNPPVQQLSGLRDMATRIVLTAMNGSTAVLLFFVLSGFVLSLSLRREQGRPFAIGTRFVVKRICRLMPAVIFCIAVCFLSARLYLSVGLPASSHIAAAADPWLAFQNALLVKIVMHGASWTIQAELLAVPFLLAAFFLQRSYGVAGLVVCFAYGLLAVEAPWLGFGIPSISATLYAFMAGMVIADERIREAFEGASAGTLALLISALFVCRLFVPLYSTTGTLAQVAICAALVGSVYGARKGAVVRFLVTPLPQYLGRISYSLYLLNVPVMWYVLVVLEPYGFYAPLEVGILAGVLTTIISIPIAAFGERVFEQGGIRLGRALTSGLRRPHPIAQAAE